MEIPVIHCHGSLCRIAEVEVILTAQFFYIELSGVKVDLIVFPCGTQFLNVVIVTFAQKFPECSLSRFRKIPQLKFFARSAELIISISPDTETTTISGIIADEISIGVVNNKTTAVRVIPVYGKGVGEVAEFGGLLGYAPIMPLKKDSCADFINRGGRIPAPIHSLRN